MIELYTAPTPNGRKISIALEELGLAYQLRTLKLKELEQKLPAFLAINPNGRVPAIVDDGFSVFESGAILVYLAEKSGRLMPTNEKGRSLVMQWLMFQMSAVGPMQGQANVFFRYFPERIQPAIDRYQNETRRLYAVLDARLAETDYVAGEYSIADIALYPWISQADWSGIDLAPLPHLRRWFDRLGARDAVRSGMAIPPSPPVDIDTKIAGARPMILT